jgi:hypothetical protein
LCASNCRHRLTSRDGLAQTQRSRLKSETRPSSCNKTASNFKLRRNIVEFVHRVVRCTSMIAYARGQSWNAASLPSSMLIPMFLSQVESGIATSLSVASTAMSGPVPSPNSHIKPCYCIGFVGWSCTSTYSTKSALSWRQKQGTLAGRQVWHSKERSLVPCTIAVHVRTAGIGK